MSISSYQVSAIKQVQRCFLSQKESGAEQGLTVLAHLILSILSSQLYVENMTDFRSDGMT